MSDPKSRNPFHVRIGISGWTYPDWRGVFYPDEVRAKDELKYASRVFNSVEVNGTFYRLQKPHTFAKWYEETPNDFIFALKAPQYVTHERRLKDVGTPVANFFASGIFALKEKLGPILWQLPPHLPFNYDRIRIFLDLLPLSTLAACEIGKGHSDWMKERALLECDADRPLYHVLEVRHESYVTPAFIDLMKQHNIGIVIGDTAGRWPLIEEKTGPITYIRMHGDETLYPDGYTKPALKKWSEKITAFAETSETVFAFLDNDHKTAAPLNAEQLMGIMKLEWKPDPLMLTKPAKKTAAKKKPAPKKKKSA